MWRLQRAGGGAYWVYLSAVLAFLLLGVCEARAPRRRKYRLDKIEEFSPTFGRVANNPLREQPNMSSGKPDHEIIQGSKKAFTVTKLEYLKKEWCKTERLKQVIRVEGCLKMTMINRFCYGQCNSFFIPKSGKKDLDTGAFKSCSFCKPKRSAWIHVTLKCPGQIPRFKKKRVKRIKECRCMAQKLN